MMKTGLVLFILMNYATSIRAQEEIPQSNIEQPEMAKGEMVAVHIDGIMMSEKVMFMDFYSSDVIIYSFPNKILASGKEEADKYWSKEFEKRTERGIELVDIYEVGNSTIAKIREMNPEIMDPVTKTIIFEFKESKISGVYFIEP